MCTNSALVYKFTCSAPQNRVPPFVETSRRPVTTHCLRLADEDAEQREDRLGQKRAAEAVRRADEDDEQRAAWVDERWAEIRERGKH